MQERHINKSSEKIQPQKKERRFYLPISGRTTLLKNLKYTKCSNDLGAA